MKQIPLIISGPPRSGTTLISSLIDQHPQINWLPDEGYYFEHLDDLDNNEKDLFLDGAKINIEIFIEGIRDRSLFPLTHKPFTDFPELIYKWDEDLFRNKIKLISKCKSIQQLWEITSQAYILALGQTNIGKYTCMKAADYGRSVFSVLKLISNSKGIIVVRDPKTSLNSLYQYRINRNEKLLTWPTLINSLKEMNRLAVTYSNSPHKERIFIIRYEELILNKVEIMRKLCSWLDIEYSTTLLEPSMLGQSWSNNSSFNKIENESKIKNINTRVLPKEYEELIDTYTKNYSTIFKC